MDISTWLIIIGMAGAASATVVGVAWKLLIHPKHQQISRLWDEIRGLHKIVDDVRLEYTKEYATKIEMREALNKVESRIEAMGKDLGDKLKDIYDILLRGKDG